MCRLIVRSQFTGDGEYRSVNWRPTLTPSQSNSKYLVHCKNRSFFRVLIGVQSRPHRFPVKSLSVNDLRQFERGSQFEADLHTGA